MWPPETSSSRYGKAIPSVSRAVRAWASRWFTASSGLRVTSARVLAVTSPTSTPPISPGPAATAIPSSSGKPIPASLKGAGDQPVEHLHMGAGGDLGHNAAIGRVLGDLAQHLVGADLPDAIRVDRDHGGGGLVAGGLDTEHRLLHALNLLVRAAS